MRGIYQIKNLINGKIYVGSAENLSNRKSVHFTTLKKNIHNNSYLQNAWNKYGEENFIFEIIEIIPVNDKNYRLSREQWWIDNMRCMYNQNGYNLSPTAGSTLGVIYSQDSKKNISNSLKGKLSGKNNPSAKINNEIAKQIRIDYSTKQYSQKELTEKYKLSIRTIQLTLYNKIWKDINYIYDSQQFSEFHKKRIGQSQKGEKSNNNKLTQKQVNEIRIKYFQKNISMHKLSLYYNVSKATIQNIIENKTWYDPNYLYNKKTKI